MTGLGWVALVLLVANLLGLAWLRLWTHRRDRAKEAAAHREFEAWLEHEAGPQLNAEVDEYLRSTPRRPAPWQRGEDA